MSERAYIGLGSNLADPVAQVEQALKALASLPSSTLIARSMLYQSQALIVAGSAPQPDYINAVAAIDTTLPVAELLAALQTVEQQQGRVRGARWSARTLDLDLLLYGNQTLQTPSLTLPHYALTERPFVVLPLLEIAPDLVLPDGRVLASLLPLLPAHAVHALPA